jgi:altronate dehydratase small subunit
LKGVFKLTKKKIIVINSKDNVATALTDLKAGERIMIEEKINGVKKSIELKNDIPFGHKVSLIEISSGVSIVKYGEIIGTASMPIEEGDYLHIHNVKSNRGRGDIKGGSK